MWWNWFLWSFDNSLFIRLLLEQRRHFFFLCDSDWMIIFWFFNFVIWLYLLFSFYFHFRIFLLFELGLKICFIIAVLFWLYFWIWIFFSTFFCNLFDFSFALWTLFLIFHFFNILDNIFWIILRCFFFTILLVWINLLLAMFC